MKKLILILSLTLSLFAEVSFDQIQSFIDQKKYEQASIALQEIIANHPKSAKAYYSMAQAQAGLGNLAFAKSNLLKAEALDPSLKFVSSSDVEKLKEKLIPPTVESISSSFSWLWFVIGFIISGIAYFIYKNNKSEFKYKSRSSPESPVTSSRPTRSTYNTYDRPTSTHTHYHNNDNSMLDTILVSGITAAAVSTILDDDASTNSNNYANPSTLNSWDDTESTKTNTSWDTPSKTNSSWESSSSDSSWSSDSSSSSSWD